MPPLPLDERIVSIQRPKSLALHGESPQTTLQHPQNASTRSCPTQPHLSRPHPCPSSSVSSTLEHKCGPPLRYEEDRGLDSGWSNTFSHGQSEATLGPGKHKRTHTIDIQLSLGRGGGAGGGGTILDKGQKISVSHEGTVKGNREKRLSLHLELGKGDGKRAEASAKCGGLAQQLLSHPRNQDQSREQQGSHHQSQPSVSTGELRGFVPAQGLYPRFGSLRDRPSAHQSNFPGDTFCTRAHQEGLGLGDKENSKLGPVHHPQNPHSLPRYHSSTPSTTRYSTGARLSSQAPPLPSFHQITQPRPSRSHEHPAFHFHNLPISAILPSPSCADGFPSPDHTCTIDFSQPFSCGCWRLVRCGGGDSHSTGHQGASGSHSSSLPRPHGGGGVGGSRGREVSSGTMGLRTLGGCLSTTSTPNTSSSNSVVSDCRAGLLRPLRCTSCSGEVGGYESPSAFRKKLVGGCLPCAPLSSSPLRALQSCVGGCNPKASQTGSSTCSYCSSDPIVVTFNPRRGRPPGMGRGVGTHAAIGGYLPDDDDYSVRTIWPEELAKKMTRSKTQPGHSGVGMGLGPRSVHTHHSQSDMNGTSPVILDCRNLLEFTRSQLTDNVGRRRLQQGKMAVLDFIGSGTGQDVGHDSLKRLWSKGGDMGDFNGLDDEIGFPRSPSPRSPSPQSPPSYSPLPSAHTTLNKPIARDRESGHTLPSAHSLHLVLNSLNREQDQENERASLSDESVMTPDVENATISPILPFLFLGNERDAQDLNLLLQFNIGFVVNVTTHLPLYHLDTGLVRYKRLPATDNSRQNLRQYFEEVFEFIEEAHQTGRGVLVHCQAGVSRSATIVIAYLMKHTLMTMMDAYKYVRSRRPVVSPNLNFMGQLLEFERDLNSGITPRILTPKLCGLETQV
ncbi:hypothetical protein COCON_G00077500 [Conger conger]|uniref:protein-tyrosine-phosphatase n=1 Tax=Conger conger TaxID=82655 RepID=A0A9Q1DNZ5_CONCO|nr:hypothetical protein COCON_G00077500 [Conger conger]